MSSRPPPSRADRALADAAIGRGVRVTARQVETWRQRGWLPSRKRQFPGAGHGSGSISAPDPPRVLYQVMYIRKLTDARVPSQCIPALLFGQGFDVANRVLVTSYTCLLQSVRSEIEAAALRSKAAHIQDPIDQAEAAASLVARSRKGSRTPTWRQRLVEAGRPLDKDEGQTRSGQFRDAMFGLFGVIHADEPPHEHVKTDMLTALGIVWANELPEADNNFNLVGINTLLHQVERSSVGELQNARSTAFRVLEIAAVFRRVLSSPDYDALDDVVSMDDWEAAAVIPFFLAWNAENPLNWVNVGT